MITDAEIERVARHICVELGLDPEERVGHGELDTKTEAELAGHSGYVCDVYLYSPRWMLKRREAAAAIAAHRAVTAP